MRGCFSAKSGAWTATLLGALSASGCSFDGEIFEPTFTTTDTPERASASLRTLVGPGEHAAVGLDVSGGFEQLVDPFAPLTDAAEQAVSLSPSWLRAPLRLRLAMLDAGLQQTLSSLLLDAPDSRIVDELAFSIAFVPEGTFSVAGFDASLLTENALALYDYDERVAYAGIVDTGSVGDDDYGSTIRYSYRDEDGNEASYELPSEIYYWYVAHPVLEFDNLLPVDPATGERAAQPTGVHWRRYVMDSSTDTFDYRDHYLLREPVDLRASTLDLPASAHLRTPNVYPLRVLVDELGNGLVTESDLGSGTLLASTVDAATAYASGTSDLLVNLVTYGNTNVTLRASARVAVILDSAPWGTDPYAEALATRNIVAATHTAPELAMLDLSALDKIIVAADQSASFYEAVAARSADLDSWVRAGGVLQLDLHTSEDISALTFLDGIVAEGEPPAEARVEGQPRLADLMARASRVWDSVAYPDLSGDRPPPESGLALDVIGWFVSQNLFDNVSERNAVAGGIERTQYPQRILHNHYGNCGEIADLMAAAGRAALLPVRNVAEVEDHTWNEVWVAGRWVPWQVDWSDSATRIDNAGVGYDAEQGGSKTLSGLYSVRGDGYVGDWPAATYTSTATLDISVVDLDGRPIDGALVLVWTEDFYTPTRPTIASRARTDAAGAVHIVVGDSRNYWLYVGSVAGEGARYPAPLPSTVGFDDLAELATAQETTPGAVIHEEVTLPVSLAPLSASGVAGSGDGLAHASAAGRQRSGWIVGGALFGSDPDTDESLGKVLIEAAPSTLRYYLFDQRGYDAFVAREPFEALAMAEDVADLEEILAAAPSTGALWLVAYNPTVADTVEVELALEVTAP